MVCGLAWWYKDSGLTVWPGAVTGSSAGSLVSDVVGCKTWAASWGSALSRPSSSKQFWARSMWTFGNCCLKLGRWRQMPPAATPNAPRRSLVADINIWTKCYATMEAILASALPAFFHGANTAWLTPTPRRRVQHNPKEAATEHANGTPPRGHPHQLGSSGWATSAIDICLIYNSPGGCFPQCRYAHLCTKCTCPHPAAECGGEQRQHTPSSSPQSVPTATQSGAQPPTV